MGVSSNNNSLDRFDARCYSNIKHYSVGRSRVAAPKGTTTTTTTRGEHGRIFSKIRMDDVLSRVLRGVRGRPLWGRCQKKAAQYAVYVPATEVEEE